MGDSAASVVLAGGAGLAAGIPHHAVTKAVHETEELPVVSENGKIDESCVESSQGAPARPSSPLCSDSMTPAAAPDKEAQTVTSSQTSHTRTSLESTVSLQGMGGGLMGDVQSQAAQNFSSQSQVTHSQSIQCGSVSQPHTTTTVSGQQSAVSVSQSQSAKNVSHSLTVQSDTQSQAAASALKDPADQPRAEPSSVDENANSIPEQEEVPAQPKPAEATEGVVAQEAAEAPEPVVVQEPASEPSVGPEPAAVPKPAPEPTAEEPAVIQESEGTPEPSVAPEETVVREPAAPPEPTVVQATAEEQESAPATEPEPTAAPEPQPAAAEPQPAAPEPQPAATEPEPGAPEPQPSAPEPQLAAPEPQLAAPEPQPAAPEPQPAAPEPQPAAPELQPAGPEPQPATPEPQPATPEPQPAAPELQPETERLETTAAPEPVPADQPEPTPEVEQMTAPQPEPCVETTVNSGGGSGAAVEEISQEHIKEQLHEIISEIEQQVLPEQEQELRLQEEDGVLHHTWKPKGRYEVPKTVIQYEEVVPITVADVAFSLKAQPPQPAPPPQPEPQPEPQPSVETRQEPQSLTNGAVSPIEIPEGIPLLARILPKDHEDGDKKISLERLFTPATDSGDLTPNRKKAFSSSSFYRPDHPTIDDQVELAQRISFSLVDENNKTSRGQSMYMKRKKRSMRWIHAGAGEGGEGQEEEQTLKHPPAKPPMKLLMSPKGVQDFHAVQEHYQALMEAAIPTSPEIGKIVTEVQSPTGKGAELFAKRKKRMDKFIVDETTVQKAHTCSTSTTSTRTQQQQSLTTAANDLALKKSAVEERNRQQQQILEQFLRSREQSLTLVKSPWQAAMETGSPDAAFDDKRQRIKLANTVCERADTKLAQAEAWLQPPITVPLVASPLAAEVTGTSAAPPVGPAAIYSAEVKVMQRSSLPPTPALDVPRFLLSQTDKSNRRNSVNFNLAAKGWGTYTNFYSPVNFAT